MKQKSLLNDVFNEVPEKQAKKVCRNNNINKFLQCFATAGKHKQIRILQIGGCGPTTLTKKPFLTTQPIKKGNGLFNNEILWRQNSKEQKDKNFRVEATRTGEFCEPRSSQTRDINRKVFSSDKDTLACTEYITSSCSPRKNKGWIMKKKNLDDLPNRLFRKNKSQNPQPIVPSISKIESQQQIQAISKSANLLNKINFSQNPFPIEERKVGTMGLKKKAIIENKKTPQEMAEQQRKVKLQLKKQISQEYGKPFNPPSNISAASYIIFEPVFSENKNRKAKYTAFLQSQEDGRQNKKYPHSHKVIASFNSRTSVQVASLTKIMTCILALELCQRYKIDSTCEKILVGKFQSNIGGTSAQISEGQIYSLQDLYYGLMLPSGNDASVAIAVWGGKLLLTRQKSHNNTHKKKDFYNRFIQQMNNFAKKLGLPKTNYANSHGLVNPENRSCAYDLAILCEYAMMNQKFRNIVGCRQYQTEIKYTTGGLQIQKKSFKDLMKADKTEKYMEKDDEVEEGQERDLDSNEETQQQKFQEYPLNTKTVQWQNTHRLLQQKPEEYIGIKTGITTAAGPCLASCMKAKNGRYLIIIVLNCDKMSMRFRDTENLKKWAYQRQCISSPRKRVDMKKQKNGEEPPQTLQI